MNSGDNMSKKEDLRIRKTKTTLYNSFLELLKTNSFEKIKIIDICSKSKINRSTFYDHFKDKYELLDSFVVESNKDLKKALQEMPDSEDLNTNYQNHLKVLLNYIEENKEIFSMLSKTNKSPLIFDTLLNTFMSEIKDPKIEKKQLFYSSASIRLIVEELKDLNTFNKTKIIKELNELIPNLNDKTKSK